MTENKEGVTKAEKVLKAEKEIRREGAKAAFLHGTIEAAILLVAVYVGLSELQLGFVPEEVTTLGPVPVSGSMAVAFGLAAVFLVVDTALTYRRRTLEYFEQVNPQIEEALRTARDAAEREEETEIADALYGDVLEELRTTSSDGFVSLKRVLGAFALVAVVALLLFGASSLGGYGGGGGLFGESTAGGGGGGESSQAAGGGGGGGEGGESTSETSEDLFGEEGEVVRGDDLQEIELGTSGAGAGGDGGDGGGDVGSPSGGTDFSGNVEVEGQRAEFTEEEEVEDAELVKEYNLRVRGD